MLNRFMLLAPLLLIPTMEAQAAGQIHEPTLSGPYSVRDLDPEVSRALQGQEASLEGMTPAGGNWWNGSGSGPYPTQGGTWYESVRMYGYPPRGAVMQTLQYYWNNNNLGGWANQVTVLLYVSDGVTYYGADVTTQPSATLSASGIPANYKVYFLMKVGDLQVPLYSPPYISYVSANVYYTY